MRILAENTFVSNDSRATRLNNNDLVIGHSGAGKTRSYVMPNLLQLDESVIVTDTKHRLYGQFKPVYEAHGFVTHHLDFTNPSNSTIGYNPLDFIDFDERLNQPSERDIMKVARIISPIESDDPFWDSMAMLYIAMLIGFTFENLAPEDRNLCTASELVTQCDQIRERVEQLELINCRSLTARKFKLAETMRSADRTYASTLAVVASKLDTLALDDLEPLYNAAVRVDFETLAQSKFALFVSVSDTDRSSDKLTSLFYTQAIDALCATADKSPRGALPHPVRLYLDDFACNCTIPDFDNVIATIRSREIAASIILQDLPQLASKYGSSRANTIINNCDHVLFLGNRDIATASYIAKLAGKEPEQVMRLPIDEAYLAETGSKTKLVKPYRLDAHPNYLELPEAFDWIDRLEAEICAT